MRIPVGRHGFVFCLVLALAGCEAPETQLNPSTPSTLPRPLNARTSDLLYVTVANTVREFSLPDLRPVRTLTGFSSPYGLCSDANGDVFVANLGAKQILEYAHDGTFPIKTLKAPGYPFDCAVDSTTGDLAVADFYGPGGGRGNVAVYKNASGNPSTFNLGGLHYFYSCAYDDADNLVASGWTRGFAATKIAELPKGGSKLQEIILNRPTTYVQSVRWSGSGLTVNASPPSGIYRLKISGSKATIDGPAPIRKASRIDWYAFGKGQIIGDVYDFPPKRGIVRFWPYPKGGEPVKTIPDLRYPGGLTVSVAPR